MTTAVLEGIAGSLSVASRIGAGGRLGLRSRRASPATLLEREQDPGLPGRRRDVDPSSPISGSVNRVLPTTRGRSARSSGSTGPPPPPLGVGARRGPVPRCRRVRCRALPPQWVPDLGRESDSAPGPAPSDRHHHDDPVDHPWRWSSACPVELPLRVSPDSLILPGARCQVPGAGGQWSVVSVGGRC